MRKILLLFITLTSTLNLFAQDSYNFTPWGVGFNASYIRPYADLKIYKNSTAFNVTGYYNLTPYVPVGLEIQFGKLAGGSITLDESKRQYQNNYVAAIFHGDLQLGEIIDYSDHLLWAVIKDFYVGTGIGIINNNMAFIQRTNLNTNGQYPVVGSYRFPGMDKSINLVVPIRIGYEYKIYNYFGEPFMGIHIGYIHSFTWGEGLDGYTDPPTQFENNALDQYRQIVIGVKFNFGQPVYYKKKINYNRYY